MESRSFTGHRARSRIPANAARGLIHGGRRGLFPVDVFAVDRGLFGNTFEMFQEFFARLSVTCGSASSGLVRKSIYMMTIIAPARRRPPVRRGVSGQGSTGCAARGKCPKRRARIRAREITHWPESDTLCAGMVSVRNRGTRRRAKHQPVVQDSAGVRPTPAESSATLGPRPPPEKPSLQKRYPNARSPKAGAPPHVLLATNGRHRARTGPHESMTVQPYALRW